MSKKNKNKDLTRQGVRNLDYIKGKSVGRKIEMPSMDDGCDHPPHAIKDNDGILACACGTHFDFDGKPIVRKSR